MQTELLGTIRKEIRGTETRLGYSAWRHGETDVEIIMHRIGLFEQHLGYVTSLGEAVQLIGTAEARHKEGDDHGGE